MMIFNNKAINFKKIYQSAEYLVTSKAIKDFPFKAKQELEANCFAAQILMPEQILRECTKRGKILTADFIQKSFGVSKEADEKILHTLAKSHFDWRSREEKEFDDIIVQKYSSILNKIAPQKVNFYNFDYDMQQERNSWLAVR